ncbi:MAG TPA: M1 family aminopeptidase [Acidobacteriaceae bacterium]|nr:M1 family aminopeptidase [Acidobacteriaceae bacterium]
MPSAWKSRLRFYWRMGVVLCGFLVQVGMAQTAQPATPKTAVQIRGYSIDVSLDPAHHSLSAKTQLDFTTSQNLATVEFQLSPELHLDNVTDSSGKSLSATQKEGEITVTPAGSLTPGSDVAWTFTYSGVLDATPGGSMRLVSIGDPVSYLLYRGDWFPVVGDGTQRFTAEMHVHVPTGDQVLSSGSAGSPHPDTNGQTVFDFNWPHPGFPGTVIAGKSLPPVEAPGAHVRLYLLQHRSGAKSEVAQPSAQEIAATAAKLYGELATQFGPTDSGELNLVELPNDTLPAVSAPEIAAIAGNQLETADYTRLLVNTIAHQWWGQDVSPASPNDAWITNGMCRYAELEYLRRTATPAVAADAILNVSASALAYNKVPLAEVVRYPGRPSAAGRRGDSREFEAMTYDKGAMILRMLRWQIGDAAFQQTLHQVLSQPDKSISSEKFEQIAEAASHQNLRPFFTQWLNNTGAPTLQDKWTLYRLGNNQGFRTVGEIDEDLDLFQMPVEVQVETEGKTVTKRVDAMGPQTQFTIDTFGIPRKVSLDPQRRLLRNDDALQVRVHILRGMAMAAANDNAGAIAEYRAALALDATSSLASYRLGEIYFRQRNYQAAEDAFRAALNGDGVPKWIEVWSDLHLGKIFDASGQRDRAINQYREAIETHDDTSGAVTMASDSLQHPYVPPTEAAH